MKVRGIRGAITVDENSADAIFTATRELFHALVVENSLLPDDIASVLLTMSPDLSADFPAKAIRSMEGWTWVPVMCAMEVPVPGALPLCIRVLIHANTDVAQASLRHLYLRNAAVLRPDLAKNG